MMRCLVVAVSLAVSLGGSEPPAHSTAHGAAPAKAAEKAPEPAKETAKETAKDKAKEKSHGTRLPSPAVPAEEPATPAPKRVVRTPKRAAPTLATHTLAVTGPLALDARAARLEAENARLRQQINQSAGSSEVAITDSKTAILELMAGNQRFVAGARVRTLLSMQDAELREHLAKGQAPFAVIITCSDSRLGDNFIFDQELGRLFTIREAGNCPDTQSLASVEYAVDHLGSKVVVVLGHVGCGAVAAVNSAHGKPLPGNLWSLQAAMAGLLESTPEDPNEAALVHMNRLVERNARRQAQVVLDRSDLVRERVAKGKLLVVPAVYDLQSGRVAFLTPLAAEPVPDAHGASAGHH